MYTAGVSKAIEIASNEAIIADDTSVTLSATDKIETMTFSKLRYNKETDVEELVPYMMLTLRWNVSDIWTGMSKDIYALEGKYR